MLSHDELPQKFYAEDMAELRTFTCFPELPLEIRNLVWKKAANFPRNLDIWARPTGVTRYRDMKYGDDRLEWKEYRTFRYTTRQPVPGVLIATRESRAATREFFDMSFGSYVDWGGGVKITTNPEILRNFQADRICPMGPYSGEASGHLWSAETPPSCAVNLYRTSKDDLNPVDELLFYADDYHEEILLYYCEETVAINGPFDFLELTEEQASYLEWQALLEARRMLQEYFDSETELWIEEAKLSHEEQGLGPPTHEDLNIGWVVPRIKFVALVVDGIRRR
jgi:hypothetical protein